MVGVLVGGGVEIRAVCFHIFFLSFNDFLVFLMVWGICLSGVVSKIIEIMWILFRFHKIVSPLGAAGSLETKNTLDTQKKKHEKIKKNMKNPLFSIEIMEIIIINKSIENKGFLCFFLFFS